MPISIRASVGLRRISVSTPSSQVAATRNMRKQFKQLNNNLLKVIAHVENVTSPAMKSAMQPIFDESQKLVPVDTSKLKKSGFIEETTFRGKPVVVLGYGRDNAPDYAAFVHENLDFAHKSPTKAKFLEDPYRAQFNMILPRVQRFMKRTLGT